LKELGQAVSAQSITVFGGAAALPDDSIMKGPAGLTVPDNCGLALIGDTHGGDLIRFHSAFAEHSPGSVQLSRPDLFGLMLNPAGLWIELFKLLLCDCSRASFTVEENGPGTRGSLI
jgi:hypothetical protein